MFFARGVKKHRVLRCFVAFGVAEIHVGAMTKPRVLRGFWLQGGPWTEKNVKLKVLQHSWAKFVDMMGPHKAKIGPRWGQARANLGQHKANIGPTWSNIGSTCGNIRLT